MKKPDPALVVLCLALFIGVLTGGQIAVEALPLAPGTGSLLGALFGGGDTPILSHAIVVALLCVACVIALMRRKVIQAPQAIPGIAAIVLFGLLSVSLGASVAKFVSLTALLEWLSFGLAMFVCVAVGGRKLGLLAILGFIVIGCVLLGVIALREYAVMKDIDSTWRVNSLWMPNSLADILTVGFLVALGFAAITEASRSLLWGLASILCGFSLVLTQSKGGLVALLIGSACFVVVLGAKSGKRALWPATRAGVVLLVVAVLAVGLQKKQASDLAQRRQANLAPPHAAASPYRLVGESTQRDAYLLTSDPSAPPASTALSRITNASGTSAQSFGFRKLLWKSAVALMKQEPVGSGIGSYRYVSAQPGLTTQTQLAHETYLQLGVEASPLAPLALLALAGFALLALVKGKAEDGLVGMRAAVFAALAASLIQGLYESNLYTFGFGLTFFALLGVALQLSVDASAPEFAPKEARWIGVGGVVMMGLAALWFGVGETMKAHLRYDIETSDVFAARDEASSLCSLFPSDGAAWYLSSISAPTVAERVEDLKKAADLEPLPKTYRALAREQMAIGKSAEAEASLRQAVSYDPNNLPAMAELLRVEDALKRTQEAVNTAWRMVDVEKTPYFAIRSIPELVPTETLEARRYLVDHTASDKERLILLRAMVSGYLDYAERTVPQIKVMASVNPPKAFVGETIDTAKAKLNDGMEAAQRMKECAQRLMDRGAFGEAGKADGIFAGVLAGLSSPK